MKAALSYLFSLLTFFALIKGLIYSVTACAVLDACLVLYLIKYGETNVKFEFKKSLIIFEKLLLYITTIILCFLFDQFVLKNELFGIQLFLSRFITGVWIFKESKSIDKNWVKIGNQSILVAIKEFISGLKCIKENIDNLKK